MSRKLNSFLYKHCAKCGKRIHYKDIRCDEHKIKEYGNTSVKRISF